MELLERGINPDFNVMEDGLEATMQKIEDFVANPFEVFTVEKLAELYPRLNEPIIDGVQRVGETMNLIAPPKVGKSWLSYGLGISVVTGRAWFNFTTKPGRVLLIDNELHRPTIAFRIPAVAKAMQIPVSELKGRFTVWPLRGKSKDIFAIESDVIKHFKPGDFDLIILDAKYRAMPPGTSENDNAAETMFYNTVDRIADQLQTAFVLIHHSSKGMQGDKRTTDVGSGAGAQSRAADAHVVLREHEQEGVVVLDAAVRSFAPVKPLALRWEFPLWQPVYDVDTTALKGKLTRADERQSSRDDESDNVVLEQCTEWRSRRQIRTLTGFSDDRANRAIRRLIDSGKLEQTTEDRKGNECEVFRKVCEGF